MNDDERRELKAKTLKAIKKSKAFIAVTFDGNNMPVFHYDITQCDNNQDIRHICMHMVSNEMSRVLREIGLAVDDRINTIKVEEAKQKRSEELSAFRSDEGAQSGASENETNSGLDIQERDASTGVGHKKAVHA